MMKRIVLGLGVVLLAVQFGCATGKSAAREDPWSEYPPPGAWKGVDRHANGHWWMPSKIGPQAGALEGTGNRGVIFHAGVEKPPPPPPPPLDSDGDGVPDNLDKCPGTPKGVKVDKVGCPLDSDGDGVPDYIDKCPGTPKGVKVDARGCPLDSDGDGVPDYKDKCPGTPKGVKVDKNGCPPPEKDSDGDGVVDSKDKCPGTPKGVKVDKVGCPLDSDGDGVPDHKDRCPDTPKGVNVDVTGCWIVRDLKFDYNKWDIKPQYYSGLDNAVRVLNLNPTMKVEIQGHTDSVGSDTYNKTLSDKRAKAVMEHIVSKGISANRLTSVGKGELNPIASNETPEGRAQNRRVEFNIISR
jgi:hypothetical protein